MKNKIKTAVVGCGKVGHLHARAYRDMKDSDFIAACNHNIIRALEFEKEYGVSAFDSVRDMVDKTGAQLVSICTPHPNHRAPAIEAIESGAHVLVEKPLAITLEDCDAILNAAQKRGVKVGVVSQRRFYPSARRLKQAIEDGKIGKPIIATATLLGWRDMAYYGSDPWRGSWEKEGGGVLVNQAPHQLDMMLWFMGEIESLCGHWATLNHPGLEVDDSAAAVIQFKNGAIGTILATNSVNPALYGNVHVHGDNGASVGVQTDGGAMFIAGMSGIAEPPFNDLWTVPGEADMQASWRKEDADFFESIDAVQHFFNEQVQDYLNAIHQNREPLVTGTDGRRTVELFQAIYESQRLDKSIKFPM